MTMMMASIMEMKPMLKAFSVSVSVSAREFLKILSTCDATSAAMSARSTPIDVDADLVGPARRMSVLTRLIEVIPVEEKTRSSTFSSLPVIDAAKHEIPVAGIDGPFQRDHVADLPPEPLRELPSRDEALPVPDKGLPARPG